MVRGFKQLAPPQSSISTIATMSNFVMAIKMVVEHHFLYIILTVRRDYYHFFCLFVDFNELHVDHDQQLHC